jgi:hypothetical protein
MTEDIYAQIEKKKNKQKKVAARSQDGFTQEFGSARHEVSPLGQAPPLKGGVPLTVPGEGGHSQALPFQGRERMTQNSAASTDSCDISPSELSNNTQEHLLSSSKAIIEGDQGLVHTAKPKSIALEVSVKQEIDEYLFQHKEVSWDTLIEAAIFHALHSDHHDSIVEDAAARLAQRKISSTKRRIQTMTQNIYHQ